MEKFILLKPSLLQVFANIWVNCITQIGVSEPPFQSDKGID